MTKTLIVFFTSFLVLISGCSENTQKEIKRDFKVGEIIHFEKPYFACRSPALYDKALAHAVRDEKSQLNAMISQFNCSIIPVDIDFRILSIQPGFGIEITNAKNVDKTQGLFTTSEVATLGQSQSNEKQPSQKR